jgi:MerR family redox-sensitive transcriptional activator SoxR
MSTTAPGEATVTTGTATDLAGPPSPATIGGLARWANVAPSTLRYYEDLGLLEPAELTEPAEPAEPTDEAEHAEQTAADAGQRRYAPTAAGIVGAILLLREVGFSVREMRELIDARAGSPRGWRQLTERKIAELDHRIAAARQARDALDHARRCQHGDIVDCPDFQAVVADHVAGRSLDPAEPRR